MARVKVELGVTVNMGNYETFRASVGFEEDTDNNTPEGKEACYNRVVAECRSRLEDLILSEGENLTRFLPAAKAELKSRTR
jgi:hypothetical protein